MSTKADNKQPPKKVDDVYANIRKLPLSPAWQGFWCGIEEIHQDLINRGLMDEDGNILTPPADPPATQEPQQPPARQRRRNPKE